MKTVNVIKKVSVHPENLDENLDKHLLSEARKTFVGMSNRDDGCFISVNKINSIIDNYVDVYTIFTVDMNVTIIKPEIGNIITAEIVMIFDSGIFLSISEIKIIVPQNNLEGGVYNRQNNTYKYKRKTYTIGDTIDVKVEQIRYIRHQTSCIASII